MGPESPLGHPLMCVFIYVDYANYNCYSMETPQNKENEQLLDHGPKLSIQEAFKKFQKEKFYQLKLNKYLKTIQTDRTAPEFKNKLRQNFI